MASSRCKLPMKIVTKLLLHHIIDYSDFLNTNWSKSPPRMLHSAVDIILYLVRWQFVLVHFGDIVTFSKPPDENIDLGRQFLALLIDAGVTLKLKKSKLFANHIYYLVHIIKPGCL